MSDTSAHAPRSDDAAAYALGALDEHEAAEFRAHADGCELCAAELDRYAGVGALLPLAAIQVATPKGLRRKVLNAAAADARSGLREPQTRGLRPRPQLARARWSGAFALAAGVALAAVLLSQGGNTTHVTRAAVASASVWHSRTVPVALLERDGSHGQLVVKHLPITEPGKVYEVWIERNDVAIPTDALFEPSSNGDASVDVPGSLAGAQAVLVTAERAGGATVPSTAPLIDARLSA
jgi:hypothetical protein